MIEFQMYNFQKSLMIKRKVTWLLVSIFLVLPNKKLLSLYTRLTVFLFRKVLCICKGKRFLGFWAGGLGYLDLTTF